MILISSEGCRVYDVAFTVLWSIVYVCMHVWYGWPRCRLCTEDVRGRGRHRPRLRAHWLHRNDRRTGSSYRRLLCITNVRYGSGLDGKISADPISLRKVTPESVDSSFLIAWVSNIWVSGTSLRVFRSLTAPNSRKSKLNRAIAEASEDRDLVAGPSVEIELDPVTVGVECKVHAVSSNLGSAILIADERQKRLTRRQ